MSQCDKLLSKHKVKCWCEIITCLNFKFHCLPVRFAELKANRLMENDKQPSGYPSPEAYSLTPYWNSFKGESLFF